MKKQLKKLSLTKKVISNFQTISGGRPPRTWERTCKETCRIDEPAETLGFCIPDTNTEN